MTSWLWAAEAELAAAAGLDTGSRHALDQAAAILPAGPSDDPELPYLSLDEHHLARWRGSVLARLGDREAVDQLSRALAAMPPEYIRATSGLLIDLAQALTAADAPDAAAEHLRIANDLVTRSGQPDNGDGWRCWRPNRQPFGWQGCVAAQPASPSRESRPY
jgi:hypothetical protein